MLWFLFTRPLAAALTVVGASLLAPVILPLTAAIIKPLVRPVTNFYLDIAEEMGEVVEERERHKACKAAKEKLALTKEPKGKEAKELKAGEAILDQVGKIL